MRNVIIFIVGASLFCGCYVSYEKNKKERIFFELKYYLLTPTIPKIMHIHEETIIECPYHPITASGVVTCTRSVGGSTEYTIKIGVYPKSVAPDKVRFYCFTAINDERFGQYYEAKWKEDIVITKGMKETDSNPLTILVVVIRPLYTQFISEEERGYKNNQ